MRIEIPMPSVASAASLPPAGLRLDRAAIAQIAALAAATPWTALDALVADRAATPGSPVPVGGPQSPPPAAAIPAALAAAAAGAVPATLPGPVPAALVGAGSTLPSAPLPPGLPTVAAGALPVAGPDRLTLSALAAAPRLGAVPAGAGPVGDFVGRVLQALTGDAAGTVTLTAFGTPPAATPATVASPASRLPQDLLQLLLRGSLAGADGQQVELTVGLSVTRQAPAGVLVDAAVLEAVRGALEQLASREVDLDFPGNAASLAGQSLRFQASFDPLALWPMQSFLLSGLLIFGRARPLADDELAADEAGDDEPVEAKPIDDDPERDARQSPDTPPKKKARRPRPVPDTPTPLPADGGLPIISASHWLELELRHWRVQVRRWMALPVEPGA